MNLILMINNKNNNNYIKDKNLIDKEDKLDQDLRFLLFINHRDPTANLMLHFLHPAIQLKQILSIPIIKFKVSLIHLQFSLFIQLFKRKMINHIIY